MNKTQKKSKTPAFQLSKEGVTFVQNEIKRYETKRSAVIPCLYRVQTEKQRLGESRMRHLLKPVDGY